MDLAPVARWLQIYWLQKRIYHRYCFVTIHTISSLLISEKLLRKCHTALLFKCWFDFGVGGKSLIRFSSFLSDRTFRVKVGSNYSIITDVSSEVIEGSVLGLSLYTIFINPLLNNVHLPVEAFANGLKFVANTTDHDQVYVQTEIYIVAGISSFHQAPLSIDKCVVLHCGRQCVPNSYTINGVSIKSVECFADLGVCWSANGTHARHYSDIIAKSSKTSGLIRRIFHQRSRSLMWIAY